MNTANIIRDDWIIGGVALLLVIDLLFLPWFEHLVPARSRSRSPRPTLRSGWAGILAVLLGIALIADLAVERLSPQTALPALDGSRTETRFVARLRRPPCSCC